MSIPAQSRMHDLQTTRLPLACHCRWPQPLLQGRERADRGGTFTLAYGVAGTNATNVGTPITVRARLSCGHQRTTVTYGLRPGAPPFCRTAPRSRQQFPARPRPGTPGVETRMEQIRQVVERETEMRTVGAALVSWPPVGVANEPHRIVSPPDQRHSDQRRRAGSAPPLRRFAPTPPDRFADGSLHVRALRPRVHDDDRLLAWNKPVGAALVGRPSSRTNRTGSCRPPTNAT